MTGVVQAKDLSMSGRKIVILTPVRDEEWILERFLLAACEVADHVLVLDQKSEDRSREICAQFPKVTVIENPSGDYSETARSRLLVESARSLFGPGNVLIALDADEILTGDTLQSKGWDRLRSLDPGTVICFEKPEMLPHPPRCLRSAYWFPMGVVDDGVAYEGRLIHSNRIPLKQEAPRYCAGDIVAMHFARLRPIEFAARQAFYCMVENVNRTKSHRVRNCYYSPSIFLRFGEEATVLCPPEWFAWYGARGVDLWSYRTERFNTFHKRALLLLAKHGVGRFRWDDIWWEDWESARQFFLTKDIDGIPEKQLTPPSRWVLFITRQLIRVYTGSTLVAAVVRGVFGTRLKPQTHV
jgi:hypothetical protein